MTKEIREATAEMRRCMGGVDPDGCVRAARRVMELREAMRNDSAMNEHLLRVVDHPEAVRKNARRRRA